MEEKVCEGCACSGHSHEHSDEGVKKQVLTLISAILLFFFGLLLPLFSQGKIILFGVAYLIAGRAVLLHAVKNICGGKVFDEAFLMSVASLGAICIGDLAEGTAVMIFYQLGELFQDLAVGRSRRSITKLMDIRPDRANLQVDGRWEFCAAQDVPVDALILIRAGERIPLDGMVVEGKSQLDTSALTGESMPRFVSPGKMVMSGYVNQTGTLTVRVTKPFGESTASKILKLAEHASSNKAKTEQFITRFARYYTPVVVLIAVIIAVFPPLLTLGNWKDYLYRALTFLVISCPCALVISVPMGFFAGIGCASKNGILVKGGNYLEALADTDTVVFDKTGTLTKGRFQVVKVISEGMKQDKVLEYAAYAEQFSSHPIATALRNEYGEDFDSKRIGMVTEQAGHGVKAFVDGHIILVGSIEMMREEAIQIPPINAGSSTVVYVAMNNRLLGIILVGDTPKPESATALKALRDQGICHTVMLTGDQQSVAEEIARKVGVDEVRADLLPDGKVAEIERIISSKVRKGKVIFIGDGINDAPVLARADVGIAMGGIGTDAAIEAADVVIMDDQLNRLPLAIWIARRTRKIVIQNIIFSLGVKVIILTLGAAGFASMWAAVFADVGVALLAVLNSLRALGTGARS